jgi:hypothetical protein
VSRLLGLIHSGFCSIHHTYIDTYIDLCNFSVYEVRHMPGRKEYSLESQIAQGSDTALSLKDLGQAI